MAPVGQPAALLRLATIDCSRQTTRRTLIGEKRRNVSGNYVEVLTDELVASSRPLPDAAHWVLPEHVTQLPLKTFVKKS